MAKEALDGVAERPFAGVHILAMAMMCAKGATADELELAERLLKRDPRTDAPREIESVAGAFNRHMDAAIDSLNDSAGEPTRVGRRARLAQDLDRAGLLLVDRATIADLLGEIHKLRDELARVDGEDLGAELAADDAMVHGLGVSMVRSDGSAAHVPLSDFYAEAFVGEIGGDPLFNPSVND
jgi:hypothetical protein